MEQERPVVRRLPEGRAAAGLCRGRSGLRHRGPRHRAEALDPGEPRLRHQGRSGCDLCRGHFVDRAGGSRGGRRARLPGQAARRRGRHRQGHRAARASDHGAARIPPIAQVMGVTNAVTVDADAVHADHAGRTGRGRHGDGLGRGRRYRRHRARRAHARRSAGRRPRWRSAARRRCSATRAATTSACWRATGPGTAADHREAPRRAEDFAGIDRAAPSGHAAHGGDDPEQVAGDRCLSS